MVAGGKDLFNLAVLVFFKDDKGKHTIELPDGGGPTELGVGVSDDLAITARDALLVPAMLLLQVRIKRVVVVDLSVGSEVDPLTLESQVEGPELWVKRTTNKYENIGERRLNLTQWIHALPITNKKKLTYQPDGC